MEGLKVLLVEDEVITAMLVKRELEKIGCNVLDLATSGEDAVRLAKSDIRPDLILMDITLSGDMDGITAASEIKEESDIPIIFLTGYQDSRTRERASQTKPLAYFVKPLEIHKLQNLIQNHF
ncbi:response regulator [Leptospira wolffii]|uniref:Response regulator n=1 Tax=Leptospira wolffii TaxID=409998 RepID=A0ABV5BPV1_9LEPT|nr:response regulator [Leptospira wolffii]TGK56765.1 response regulator [Leptospira wolffii]TGK71653.1 response regulator [Leptospira wolffii]TGK75490.1 response regulator [Leptospira wolffii]TGL33020.1 response regulator [Leptospira wolffii]TGL53816.1 response regulator [Leptospira wolffii]